MKFFSKISSKKPNSADEEEEEPGFFETQPPSPSKSPTKSSGSRSPSKRAQRPVSPTTPRDSKPQQSPRPSRPFARHSTDSPLSSSRRKKVDPDTHPLNLPPEQRKRLSELSALNDRVSMDVDKEPVNGGNPSPPPPPQPQQQQFQRQKSPPPAPPSHSNSFTVPVANGVDSATNGTHDEAVPPPPPHRSQPSSPVQQEAEQAESFKNEGNKFFKAGDYTRALEFYTKGEWATRHSTRNVST